MAFDYLKELINASPITTVSTLVVIFLGILYFLLKDRDLPPGPTGLPFLGYWPFLTDENIHLVLTDFMKKYGDVYSFTISGKLYIHLGSIKTIKEAHLTKSDCFTERITDYNALSIMFNNGIAVSNGEEWRVLRKFFVQTFREYGLTSLKDYMAGPIYDSVKASVENIKATNGSPFNIIQIINDRSSDIFRRMMFNEGGITDEELKGILESFKSVLSMFSGRKHLLTGKFARYFIFPRLDGFKSAIENLKKIRGCLKNLIRRHEKTYSEGNVRDVVDSYIKERNERRKKGDLTAKYFSEDALVATLTQFVGDGILGVAVFIAYFIHGLLEYPEEQEKIYKEIKDVIGPDRDVTMEDKNKLPYTNAFLQEIIRTSDFFTIFPSLVCTKEATLNGYRIPKGSLLMSNLWASQRDPNIFDDPDEFKPSRYINEPGKPKTEAPIIFGVGKRSCIGESFTMMQVFLFITSVVKNFRLERPKGNVKKNFFDGNMEVCAYPRK